MNVDKISKYNEKWLKKMKNWQRMKKEKIDKKIRNECQNKWKKWIRNETKNRKVKKNEKK